MKGTDQPWRRRRLAAILLGMVAAVAVTLLAGSLMRPGQVLLARWGLVAALHPGGGVWILRADTRGLRDPGPGLNHRTYLVIYDVLGTNFIVTHSEDGTARVQHLGSRRWVVRPVSLNSSATPGVVTSFGVLISAWWLAFLSLVGAAWAALAAHAVRRRRGCCRGCGYPRSGLAAVAPCPECGVSPG